MTHSSPDCVTAVNVSVKDKLTLSSAVAIGSTIVSSRFLHCESTITPSRTPSVGYAEQQLSLFVIPLMVIVAWITGYPLGLLFDPFESVALYLAGMCFLRVLYRSAAAIDSPHCFHPLSRALSSY